MRSIKVSRRSVLFFGALALLLIPSLSARGGMLRTVVAFGDSLSDNGNLYWLTAGAIPDSRHFEGRFSNGPVWVEYLAAQTGAILVDLAYGGASTGGGITPSLKGQINRWQPQDALQETLFTIWAGATDYLLMGSTDAQKAVGNILSGLETLAGDGASRIMVLNLPDLGLTPEFLSETTETQAEASAYSLAFNQRIAESLASFSGDHPGVIIYFLDVYGLFRELVKNPERFGFQNSTEVSPNFGVNFQNDGGYVFWEGVHPTTEAHAFLAGEAAALLSEDCARVNADLSMNLFLVEYGGLRFGFTLSYLGGIGGDPEGSYWEMDLATLGVESDQILGIDHAVADNDLDLLVPCAEFAGNRYAFRLDFVDSGAEAFLWRLDVSSLTVK